MQNCRLTMKICCASQMFLGKVGGLKDTKPLLDSIFILGDTQLEHDQILKACLSTLEQDGITYSPDKCQFNRKSMEFFVIKFTCEGMATTEEMFKALMEAENPTTKSELRSYLGLASFCSRANII